MDKSVLIVGVIAVVVVIGVTVLLFGSTPTPSSQHEGQEGTQNTPTAHDNEGEGDTTTEQPAEPRANETKKLEGGVFGNYIDISAEGDCQLYKHVAKEKYECFGTAGNFTKYATNEYKPVESDKYFCRATKYGCRLYQKVEYVLG